MRPAAAAALGLVLVLGVVLTAQEAAKGPAGTWERTEGEVKIRFDIKAHTLRATLTKGEDSFQADVDYGATKDSVLFGRINKVEKKGAGEGPQEGQMFSFRFEVKGNTLTLSNYEGPGGGEARQLIEGEYKGKPVKSGAK